MGKVSPKRQSNLLQTAKLIGMGPRAQPWLHNHLAPSRGHTLSQTCEVRPPPGDQEEALCAKHLETDSTVRETSRNLATLEQSRLEVYLSWAKLGRKTSVFPWKRGPWGHEFTLGFSRSGETCQPGLRGAFSKAYARGFGVRGPRPLQSFC